MGVATPRECSKTGEKHFAAMKSIAWIVALLVLVCAGSLSAADRKQTVHLIAITCAAEQWRAPDTVQIADLMHLGRPGTLNVQWARLSRGVYSAETRLPAGYFALYLKSGACHTTPAVDFALIPGNPRHIVAVMADEFVLADRGADALVVIPPSAGLAVSLIQHGGIGGSHRIHPHVDEGILYFDNLWASDYSLAIGSGTWGAEIPLDLRNAKPGSVTVKRITFEEILAHIKH